MGGRCWRVTTLTHARTPKTQKITREREPRYNSRRNGRKTSHDHTHRHKIDRFCSFFCLFAVVCITLCCDEPMSSACVCGCTKCYARGFGSCVSITCEKVTELGGFLHERVARRSTFLLLFSVQNFQTREKRNTHEHARTIASLGERIFRRKKRYRFHVKQNFSRSVEEEQSKLFFLLSTPRTHT